MPHMICPACGGTEFGPYNKHPQRVCVKCRSLERGRFQVLILKHLGLPRPGSRILHVAPEPHLFRIFSDASGEAYHPCDYEVGHQNYRRLNAKLYEIDLCRDIFRFPSNCFDLIVHNHVLEHVPCSVSDVLEEHKRILAPEGYLVFSVPFRGTHTDEDLSNQLTDEDRVRRFGQADHVRIFGTQDFPSLLVSIFGKDLLFDASHWSDEFLESGGVPAKLAKGVSGVSNFVWQKPAARPSQVK